MKPTRGVLDKKIFVSGISDLNETLVTNKIKLKRPVAV